jgi:ubiquinone/menaquinone biosynthesis C-methylase UbiE
MSIASRIKKLFIGSGETSPGKAYDWWAGAYDDQPNNLMLAMDEQLFSGLLNDSKIEGFTIADVGCGTGRHWKKIMDQRPAKLIGYDVSQGMLDKLKEKFPTATTHLIRDHRLPELADQSCDMIISTLAIAHVPEPEKALQEWNRVLKPGGEIIITDYHPEALARGGKRTFKHQGRTVAVKNYIHSIEKIRLLAKQLHWKELRFSEKLIDDSVKDYYERQNAMDIFNKFRNTPIIYGIHLKKSDDPA